MTTPARIIIDAPLEAANWFQAGDYAQRIAGETSSPRGRDMVRAYMLIAYAEGLRDGAARVVGHVNENGGAIEIAAPPRRERSDWAMLSPASQAGIRCGEAEFRTFLQAESDDEAARIVRQRCGVASRAEFNTNRSAAAAWRQIETDYQNWRRR